MSQDRTRQLKGFRATASAAVLLTLAGCSSGSSKSPAATTVPVPAAQVTVTVSGAAQTRTGLATQFTAAVTNTSNTAVTWQVNGITGGSASTGTISAGGLYTAPATLPSPNSVTISAISSASSSVSGSLTEAVWNPVPVLGSAAATQTGTSTTMLVDVLGSSFVQGAAIQVGGTSAITTFVSSTELQATVSAPIAGTTVSVDVLNPDPGSIASTSSVVSIAIVKVPVAAAARLLDQATFGPTLSDIQHVQNVGLDPWLAEQFNATPTLLPDLPNPLPTQCAPSNPKPCEQSEWWTAAMTGPDQLRQRVAFALSEMFVVSTNSDSPYAIIPYQNILTQDAFGNFSTLMKDVTLSTAMGAYLNMLNSAKPATGQIANENYSRELMQLFTLGLNQLNQDGTPQLDSTGKLIPTYTESQVEAFARAYTGWTYATATGGTPTGLTGTANYDHAMVAVAAQHDTTAKILLGGTTLAAGQTAAADLDGALANIFAQSNVAPFVCRQLIQHLVASNPSPAYVGRISAVFNNNGNGVRGDLRAVIRAILLDTEARAGDTDPTQDGGHLREPILYLTGVLRGLGFSNTDSTGYYGTLSNYSGNLSQQPYSSPSVFNFFPPDYVVPDYGVNAPEFDLENTASAILRLTLADNLVYNRISGFNVNLSATGPYGLLAANPGNLVDALGTTFMHGQMPTNMRTAIVNHISTLTDMGQRARVATYLVITSSQYKILH